MAASAHDLSGIIGRLYEAALDSSLWSGLSSRLAQSLEASSAVVKLQAPQGLELIDTTDNFGNADRDPGLAEHWHRNDLWVRRSAAYGFNRVVLGHELTPFEELEETGYYRDWLRPLAIRDMVGGVVQAGSAVGVLGVHRGPGEPGFSDADRTAVEILLPHLERAFRIRGRLADAEAAAGSGLAALEAVGLAILVVEGARKRTTFINAAAERLLLDGVVTVRAGRLVATDPVAQSKLDLAFSLALANGQGFGERPPAPIVLCRPEAPPLIVSVAPLPARMASHGEPSVLVILRELHPARPAHDLLRAAFGLTRGEAAVAAALCGGLDLRRIAVEQGIALATVRSHLKSIMLKTQTRRQAELVALLMSLPNR
jgi:DNA-binding CsgD family transcriptional regulator